MISRPRLRIQTRETAPETPAPPDAGEEGAKEETPKKTAVDFEKHKKKVDKILEGCQAKLTDEVSALVGVQVKFSDHQTVFISKEDFFLRRGR